MSEALEPEIVSEVTPNGSLERYEASNLALTAVFDLATAKSRLAELNEFVKFYMKEGEDYGTIPGTPKPTLYKSGADKLCDIYGIADQYRITYRTEDWSQNLFDYEVECTLVSKRNGRLIASGLGSCNSFEGKYRYRDMKRLCPKCHKETIIKGKEEYGGGWLCWNKPGKSDGCGAKFQDGDASIEGQAVGKAENEDIPTLKNTLLKMAKKRAKVDAVLSATRSSGLFTQDIEDIRPVEMREETTQPTPPPAPSSPKKTEPAPSPHKAVFLKELGDGNVSLYGDGLSIILVALGEPAKGQLGMSWQGSPHGWVMPMKSSFALEDICKAQGVGFTYVADAENAATGTPAPANATPQLGHGKITNTEMANSKRGPFMRVWQGGNKMQAFDNPQMKLPDGTTMALFTMLKVAKGKDAIFRVNKVGNYFNIVGVAKLGNLSWDETGAPVVQR